MRTIKKELLNSMKTHKICILIVVVSLLLVPFTLRAQVEEYGDDQGNLVATSNSRMVVNVIESTDHVELQVSVIGHINARAFFFNIVYDTTALRLTDNTYLYDIPDGTTQNDFNSPVIFMPEAFSNKYYLHYTDPRNHYKVNGGDGSGMKTFCSSINVISMLDIATVKVAPGEMLHLYSIYLRKVTPGKPLTTSDFGYYSQLPTYELYPVESASIMHFAFQVRYSLGMPWSWFVTKPELFTFRTPSDVLTETPTNILTSSATLNANFTRGSFQPTDSVIVSGWVDANYTGKLDWDTVSHYGFIYSNVNAEISVNGYTNKINIDGIDFDFPNATELALGVFVRNGKTFYIQQFNNNNSSNQEVSYSQNITGLIPGNNYYAWSFIHYAFETSNTFLNVGNKVMFHTTHVSNPVVYIHNFIYCDGEHVSAYTFEGEEDAVHFEWKRMYGYDFGLTETSGMDIIPAFVATNVGFEAVSALYEVTPVDENGYKGEPQQFLITVNPRPVTTNVENMVYCNGITAPRFDFAGTIPASFFEWEFVNEIGSTLIPGIPNSGENYIPSFVAYNPGNEPLTGKYRVRASYSFDNLTCYENEWNYFEIVILPAPKVVAITPTLQTICSGSETEQITFSSNIENVIYQWSFNSGDILTGFPTQGQGNIPPTMIINNKPMSAGATYQVVAILNDPNYIAYTCESQPAAFGIMVSPTPQTANVNDFVYCNGVLASGYTFTGTNPLATYYWEFVSGDPIPGLPASGINQLPSFVAINNGNAPLSARYKVNATYGDFCPEADGVTFSVTVLPTPAMATVTPTYQTICSGEETEQITFNSNVENATYKWSLISGDMLQGFPTQGEGNIPPTVIFNENMMNLSATYQVVTVLNNSENPSYTCESQPAIFGIMVNPIPVITTPTFSNAICSGSMLQYTMSTSTPINEISWVRLPQPEINNNEGASGKGIRIEEVLRNTGTTAVTVKYLISAVAGICEYENIAEVTVEVMPEIALNVSPVVVACYNAPSFNIEYGVVLPGTEYKLLFDPVAIAAGFVSITDFRVLPHSKIVSQIPNGVKPGNYYATLTVRLGQCTMDYDILIVVKDKLTATELSDDEIFLCEKEMLNLYVHANDNVQYQWFFEDVIIPDANTCCYETVFNASKAGTYSVEISNECETITYYFHVYSNPVIIEQKWNDVLYVDNSSGKYVAYQWYKNGTPVAKNGNAQYYTEYTDCFTKGAEYNVRAYKADGSYDEACAIIPNDGSCDGGTGVVVYPNPVNNGNNVTILLKTNGTQPNATAHIFDIRGRLVATYSITDYRTEVVVNWAAGNYVIKVTMANGEEFIEKLIIQK